DHWPREKTPVLGPPRAQKSELRLSPQQTVKAVEAGGLKSTAIVDIPPYHYGAIFEKPSVGKTCRSCRAGRRECGFRANSRHFRPPLMCRTPFPARRIWSKDPLA